MVGPSSRGIGLRREWMNQAIVPEWRRADRRRRLAVLGGSLAVHAAVLALIGHELVQTRLTPDPAIDQTPVFIELEPRPLLPGEAVRRPTAAAMAAAETQPLNVSRSQTPDAPRLKDEDEDDRPSAPSPRLAASPPAGTAAPSAGGPGAPATNPWAVRPADRRGAMARSLRLGSVGCRTMDGHLSEAEQRFCDDDFNADAGRARPIGPRTQTASEARRQEQFAREGAAALARYERRRAPMRSGVGVVGAAPECPGGNLRGTCPGANLPSHYQHQEEAPFGGTAGPK